MAKVLQRVGVSAAVAVAGFLSGQAGAMPIGAPSKALERIAIVEQAQYTYQGRSYCWYDDGWNGPGWYVCGEYSVRGVGWGGAAGWNNWTHSTTVHGGSAGRVGGTAGRTGGTAGRTGGSAGRTGGGRTGGSRAGGGRTGGHASGRTGGGRSGGGGRGGGRRSDVLLKHDIALLGRLDNGLGF